MRTKKPKQAAEFITVKEAAELVGKSKAAIYYAIERGDLIGGKVNGTTIVLKSSLDAYTPNQYPVGWKKEDKSRKPNQVA